MDTDRYGRVVAVCFRGDGVEVNAWLVRNGFAIDYRKYSRGRYLSEQSEAQRHKRGVWRGTFVNPDDYRRVKRGGGGLARRGSRWSQPSCGSVIATRAAPWSACFA
jgi:endonuclease YncB( thermonuclease family)